MIQPVSHSTMPAVVTSTPSIDTVPTGSNGLGGVQNAMLNENNFFQLLTAQLENQDPLNTMTASDFAAQLAQFSTAIGVQNMQQTQAAFGGLQLSSLVGQNVAVHGNSVILKTGSPATGAFALAGAAADVVVQVTDTVGNPLATIDLGAMNGGTQTFTWNGTLDAGGTAAPGTYQFQVTAVGANKTAVQTATYAVVPVTGVSLGGASGPLIDLGGGLPPVGIGNIYQVF